MELDELHVDELGPGPVREGVAVARALPAIARDLVGTADAARGQDHGFGCEGVESPAIAVVGQHARYVAIVEQQIDDRVFHVDLDAQVDGVVLQRANQFQASTIADVREARVTVAAEVALVDAAVGSAIEHGAPRLQLADAVGRLSRVEFSHPPVVDVLPTSHRVGKMHLPVVAVVVVAHRGGHAALGHHRVGLAEQGLADEADRDASRGRFDRGSQAGAARAYDQHVVALRVRRAHQNSLRSVITPIEQRRT